MAIAFVTNMDNQATSFTYTQANANEMLFFVTEKSTGAITVSVGGSAATQLADVTIGAGTHMQFFQFFSATSGSKSITSTNTPDNIGLSSYTGMDTNSIVATTPQSGQSTSGNYVRSVTQTLAGGWQVSAVFTDFGTMSSVNGNFTRRALCENCSIFDTNGTIASGSYTGTYISSGGSTREYGSAVVEVKNAAAVMNSNFLAFM